MRNKLNNQFRTVSLVLKNYEIEPIKVTKLQKGLINLTFKIETGSKAYILQRLNPVFGQATTLLVSDVAEACLKSGLNSFKIVKSKSRKLIERIDNYDWRLLTHLDGSSIDKFDSPLLVGEAASLLANFHIAVRKSDFPRLNKSVPPKKDYAILLKEALAKRRQHRSWSKVCSVAAELSEFSKSISRLPEREFRLIHGDPKVSNFLFDLKDQRAVAILDFDTFGWGDVTRELGDAFRSWCNPFGEDHGEGQFELDFFRSGLQGYLSISEELINVKERESIVNATLFLFSELSYRFLLDALEETYFAWDPDRFSSASEHNLIRASGQLATGLSLLRQRREADLVARMV